jgi:hypothetical protein
VNKCRPELESRMHQKISIYATFIRRSRQKMNYNFIKEPTILLRNISLDKKEIISDHIWVNLKEIKTSIASIPFGSRLYLTGTVYAYYKESKNKIHTAKYSIRDIDIITVDGLPLITNV